METVYICGPMRGYEHYNFPAFDAAEERLRDLGYKVFSPAAIDRENDFDPILNPEQPEPSCVDVVRRDIEAIIKSDCVVLLEGWEASVGSNAEIAIAKWLKKPVYEMGDFIYKHYVMDEQKAYA